MQPLITMNSSKIVSALSRAAALAAVASLTGLAFNVLPAALFVTAVSLFVLLVAVSDYAPRSSYLTASASTSVTQASLTSPLRLAA